MLFTGDVSTIVNVTYVLLKLAVFVLKEYICGHKGFE